MPGPACFAITTDAGRRNQCSVHQGAGAHHDALGLKLASDSLEQHAVQATADRLPAEPNIGRPLRRWLMDSETTEPTEAGSIVQCLGQPYIGEVVPSRQQHGAAQSQRQPARLALHRGQDANQMAANPSSLYRRR